MNSRQYEKMMTEVLIEALISAGIKPGEFTATCLSTDRTTYEVTMLDGTIKTISSGLEYCTD